MTISDQTPDLSASTSEVSHARPADIQRLHRKLAELETSLARLDKRRLPRKMRQPARIAALALLVVGVSLSAVSAIPGELAEESALFIDSTGQVGIGTTSPQHSLDVKGAIRSQEGGIQFPDGTTQTTAAVPVGAVIAFDLDACPAGWSEYRPAYGRFVRGIDRSGEKIDQDEQRKPGSLQDDGIRNIKGSLNAVHGGENNAWPWGFRPGQHGAFSVVQRGGANPDLYNRYGDNKSGGAYAPPGGSGGPADFDASKDPDAHVRGEVRPKNVALLYCRKDKE